MSDMTPREAADQAVMRYPAMAALPCFRRLVDHARATDLAAGGDLAAMTEAFARFRHEATGPDLFKHGRSGPRRGASPVGLVTWADAPESWREGYRELCRRDAGLLAAPASKAATESGRITAAWAQHLDDTAQYAGGFTEPERAGIRAAARMLRDPNVQAQVAKTVGGES